MSVIGTVRKASSKVKIFAVLAVLLMVVSAFAVINSGSSDATVYDEESCLEIKVVYHLYYDSAPVITANNESTPANTTKTITYYGTVVSTEYNPQVWEFKTEKIGRASCRERVFYKV